MAFSFQALCRKYRMVPGSLWSLALFLVLSCAFGLGQRVWKTGMSRLCKLVLVLIMRFRFDAEHRLFLNDVFKHYIPNESDGESTTSSPVWEEKSPTLANIDEHEEVVEQPAHLRVVHSHDPDEPQDNLLRVPSNNLESILSRTTTQIHDGRRVKLMVDDGPTRGLSLQDGNGKPLKLPRVSVPHQKL